MPGAGADYLQWGADAARTGAIHGLGPTRDDVAFMVDLPGFLPDGAHPLILDGSVYVLRWSMRYLDDPPVQGMMDVVVRVDLADPDPVEVLVELDSPAFGLASDGRWLYVVREWRVDAFGPHNGETVWSWEWEPRSLTRPTSSSCVSPALVDDRLYLLCQERGVVETPIPDEVLAGWQTLYAGHRAAYVMAVDTRTGEEIWTRDILAPGQQDPGLGVQPGVEWVSAIGDQVVTMTWSWTGSPSEGDRVFHVHGFLADDGEPRWHCSTSRLEEEGRTSFEAGHSGFLPQWMFRPSPVVGDGEQVHFVLHNLWMVDPGSPGSPTDCPSTGHQSLNQNRAWVRSHLALRGEELYVASGESISMHDRSSGAKVWERVLPSDRGFVEGGLIVAGDVLYVGSGPTIFYEEFDPFDPDGTLEIGDSQIQARDRSTGDLLWVHDVADSWGNRFNFAVADGVLVTAGETSLLVLGTTPASLEPVAKTSDTYPPIGQPVLVDLTASGPGVHGEPNQFRAVWGDGVVTSWQDNPILVHEYLREGEYVAEFQVRNDAGQSATTTLTFHVGADPPKDLNFLQTVFAPDNQNMTFGVLGILMAMSIAVLGVVHQKQRRGRLQREIDAADAVYAEGRDEPVACQRALKERRMLARGLVVDGKLEEAQFALLRDHIDGLSRSLRVPLVEEEFAFLPGAMLVSLRKMMEDGRITRFERDKFLEELAKARSVTKVQKQKVRERLESWFLEDAGGESK